MLGFVVVIVMGMLIDSLRSRDGPGSAAGMASLAVGLGLAVALGLTVGGPRVRLGESDPAVPIRGFSIGPDDAASRRSALRRRPRRYSVYRAAAVWSSGVMTGESIPAASCSRDAAAPTDKRGSRASRGDGL